MISYYNQEKITKPPSYYKLTQREFDIKYQSGYDSFVSQVVEILSSRTSSSKFAESNHRGLLESLFAKKKELKKIQEELNMVREIYKPTEKPIVEAQVAKKDEKDEQTEVKVI